MAMSGAERQANFQARRRQAAAALADALAEVEALRARVEVLQRERDRFEALVGYALKQEEWAEAEAERSAKGSSRTPAALGWPHR